MGNDELGERTEVALVALLRRKNRAHLYERALEPVDDLVDAVRYPTLSGIYWYGPISAAALSEHVGLDRTVTSRYAAQLESVGLVTRDGDPHDARASLLSLTSKGRSVISEIRLELAQAIEDMFDDWPAGLAAAFVDGLERFVASAPAAGDHD